MKANLSQFPVGFLAATLMISFGASASLAQAPEGPQGGQQQKDTPPQQQPPPTHQQKPQDAGASISVEVPVVTLDVIATTNRRGLPPRLTNENFRIIDKGVP